MRKVLKVWGAFLECADDPFNILGLLIGLKMSLCVRHRINAGIYAERNTQIFN